MATGAVRLLWRDDAIGLEVLALVTTGNPGGRKAPPELHQAARELALARLGAVIGSRPESFSVERSCARCGSTDHGKPRLGGDGAGRGDFGLAYSGALALVGVVGTAGLRVGVDLEAVPPDLAAGRWCFTDAERRRLGGLEPGEARTELARSWARKEAVAKSLGLGLALPLRRAVVTGPSTSWELPAGVVGLFDLAPGPGLAGAAALARDGALVSPNDRAETDRSFKGERASFILSGASRGSSGSRKSDARGPAGRWQGRG